MGHTDTPNTQVAMILIFPFVPISDKSQAADAVEKVKTPAQKKAEAAAEKKDAKDEAAAQAASQGGVGKKK